MRFIFEHFKLDLTVKGVKQEHKKETITDHSKSASVQSQDPDVIVTEYVFPITHLEVGFSLR